MKLYTYCSQNDCEIKCKNDCGVKLKDYSTSDYKRFMKEASKNYIRYFHSWYDTDMSDSDSGSDSSEYSINQTNIVVRDGKLYGILVEAGYSSYYVFELKKERFRVERGGGYSENSFDWFSIKNNLDELGTLKASLEYVVIKETIKANNNKKLKYYTCDVFGLIQKNCILDKNKVIGFRLNGREYFIDDKSTHVQKVLKDCDEENLEFYDIYSLVKVDEEFLEKNIFNVSYFKFTSGKYTSYTKLK